MSAERTILLEDPKAARPAGESRPPVDDEAACELPASFDRYSTPEFRALLLQHFEMARNRAIETHSVSE